MNDLKWLVIGLIVLLILLFLMLITKLTILINYHHYKDDDQLNVKIKAWYGLITYKIDVPLIKIDDNQPAVVFKEKVQMGEQRQKESTNEFTAKDFIEGLNDMKQLLTHIISLHKIIRTFLRKVTIKKIEWHSMIGVGDAAATGTLTGALWSVKGGLMGILSNYMRLKDMPIMSITPSFQRPVTQTKFQCMIQFRLGYAMLAGIKLVKFWKGGRPNFQSDHLKFLSKDKTNSV